MKQDTAIPLKNNRLLGDQLDPQTPAAIAELIETQLVRAADAAARIESEGLVVRDMRGSVVAHPAVAIEAAATRLAAELIKKHQRVGNPGTGGGFLGDMEI